MAIKHLQYDVEHDIETYLKVSVKELNKFHSYETVKKSLSDAAEFIKFGSSTRDRHAHYNMM